MNAKDFKHLQWAIVFLVVMVAIGGGSVWTVQQWKKSSERAFQEASATLRDIQGKLSRARDEQQELGDKIARFQALKARGFVGAEQRLDWIEAIARIKTARRIASLDYEFAPQRALDSGLIPGAAPGADVEIRASQMRLQIQVLHEGELLAFLAELRDAVQALVQVRSCTLERLAPGNNGRANNPQIRAECVLEWITLREGK